MSKFRMPSLGADMEAGRLVQWLKRPGDAVKRGDIIAVVETQKGAIEIEVFEDGTVETLEVDPGIEVPVGTVLATIRGAGAPPAEPSASSPEVARPAVSGATAVVDDRPVVVLPRSPRVSPLARKLAAEAGVDLTSVIGTGPQGVITRQDVERAVAGVAFQPLGAAAMPPTSRSARGRDMRVAIAAAMSRSKREIPHYYLSSVIDLNAALTWLRRENDTRPVTGRLLPAALFIKAVAKGLREVPELNGSWVDGGFRPGGGIHIGVAIVLRGGGLVAPAIHDTDRLDIPAIMQALSDLVARARSGSLKSSELADPTVTVTNMGEQGVESVFGIIYPPQVALVGFGRIVERPWVVDGAVVARPVVTVTLSADHRATDGHRGGLLLSAVGRLLQQPEVL
jgi:pyruvate dehydrogenase E2 component (dihydrolipoamide acetyltransferase)